MATSHVEATEGTGKKVAAYSFTEDAATKYVQRIAFADSAGAELGTSGNPITVEIATTQVQELVAHGTADAGSPVKTGGVARAGLSGETLIDAGDRSNANFGLDGAQYVRMTAGLEDIVVGNISNTDGASTEVIAAAGSGIKQYLTSVTITNTSASMAYVELKSGTTVRWRCPVPANGGYTFSWPLGLPPNAANEAWNADPSAATTTLYVSLAGFKSKV